MQLARSLSLLFLILMGTELTQVRASNAISSLRARRPPGPEPAKSGSRSAQLGAPHPALPGRGPRDWGGDQLHLGCRRGAG